MTMATPNSGFPWDSPPYGSARRIPEKTYITEMTVESFRLMGQLVHLYIGANPRCNHGAKALEELVQQTNIVFRDPRKHKVFYCKTEAPPKAIKFEPIYYIPII